MDTGRVLIDTSIILGYLRRKEKENTLLYNLCHAYDELFVSSVTVFEVFYGCDPEHEAAISRLFEGFSVIPFDADIARFASAEYRRLRHAGGYIEVRELVVGATAIIKQIPLATLNAPAFRQLPDIKIIV
ncbi:PilT protein domain protein [Candidatus Moduliflexus flocculans]|uniref:PilT protein domain protein n=1 Tax=Candidatus Moduliflexus flocculans TaxID=1499966 RepID=A0A0S6W4H9_9BACT|nr:PilT protein domain protein [Candidatus Moduliflexus flocculans]